MRLHNKAILVLVVLTMTLAFASCGKSEEASYSQVDAAKAKQLMETEQNYVILDVRTDSEFSEGHIPGAMLIPDYEIEEKAEGIVYSIYKELGKDSAFASFIRSSDSGTLEELEEIIQSCWNRQQVEGKDKLFNIVDYSLSILLAHDSIRDDLRLSELLNNAGGVMYSRDMDTWKAVIVYINSSYTVEEAMEKTISRETFSASDWKRVTYIGEQMRKR